MNLMAGSLSAVGGLREVVKLVKHVIPWSTFPKHFSGGALTRPSWHAEHAEHASCDVHECHGDERHEWHERHEPHEHVGLPEPQNRRHRAETGLACF